MWNLFYCGFSFTVTVLQYVPNFFLVGFISPLFGQKLVIFGKQAPGLITEECPPKVSFCCVVNLAYVVLEDNIGQALDIKKKKRNVNGHSDVYLSACCPCGLL